jgi:RNA polymerase sigma factor (sigma-70 family)
MNMRTPFLEPASGWAHLARQIAAGDAAAFSSLYLTLQPLLFHYRRQIGISDSDDLFQETIIDLYAQIRKGVLRDPERLVAYAWGMARNKIACVIRNRAFSRTCEREIPDFSLRDWSPNPEDKAMRSQQEEIAGRILHSLPEQHREVLVRFYLEGHSAERIQTDLQLTATQFRLIKSRAKARFSELCKARMESKSVPAAA